jgi:hypothetical protein
LFDRKRPPLAVTLWLAGPVRKVSEVLAAATDVAAPKATVEWHIAKS